MQLDDLPHGVQYFALKVLLNAHLTCHALESLELGQYHRFWHCFILNNTLYQFTKNVSLETQSKLLEKYFVRYFKFYSFTLISQLKVIKRELKSAVAFPSDWLLPKQKPHNTNNSLIM